MTARGFSEFDTFRSNQIREGMMEREAALEAVLVENRPRYQSLVWYLDTIGLDFNSTIARIQRARRWACTAEEQAFLQHKLTHRHRMVWAASSCSRPAAS
ncbi:MAG: hypothetical protein IPI61_13110 [Syntrophaceae bacterium]|nr:hypothetical protein [Syntrophaceae bacterium]